MSGNSISAMLEEPTVNENDSELIGSNQNTNPQMIPELKIEEVYEESALADEDDGQRAVEVEPENSTTTATGSDTVINAEETEVVTESYEADAKTVAEAETGIVADADTATVAEADAGSDADENSTATVEDAESRVMREGPQSSLRLVPRSTWDTSNGYYPYASQQPIMAQRVAVLQTDTEQCETLEGCSQLILNVEHEYPMMKYNFIISKPGNLYEALGWTALSPLYTEKPTMVVAFIGNYEHMLPTDIQLDQFKDLLSHSIEMGYLSKSYTLVGRKIRDVPTRLFEIFYEWPEWKWEDSDSDVSIDFEPFLIDSE